MSTSDFPEELASQLGDAADAIDEGDSTVVLAQVHGAVGRRRRRRQAAVGVAAIGALAASGLVIANVAGDNGDDMIVSAPPTDPVQAAGETTEGQGATSTGDGALPEDAPEADATEVDTTEESSQDEQPVVPAPEAAGAAPAGGSFPVSGASVEYLGEVLNPEELPDGYPSQLMAWNGGFLSIGTVSEPQPLPSELPPEIAEQFPQEVLDLFPDGLPATIGEATVALQEAGLYDVVSEIVLENSDVYDAIYGQPVTTLSVVRFSTDGENWENVDSAIPSEVFQQSQLVATGDRIAALTVDGESMTVRSSTDLVTWQEQSFPIPQRPADRPAFITYDVYPSGLVVNADGWIAQFSTYGEFDASVLPEGPLKESVSEGLAGYGFGDDGIEFTIEVGPDWQQLPDDEIETILVTWEELGVEGSPEMQSLFERSRVVATWSGVPQEVSTPSAESRGQLLALDDGFVEFGNPIGFSTDGRDWVDLETPFEGHAGWSIATENGFLVRGSDDFGRSATFAYDLSEAVWTTVDMTDFPSDAFAEQSTVGVALLTDYGDPFADLVATQVLAAESDGYRYEQRVQFGDDMSSTYTVTRIDTGEVVSTETLSGDAEFGAEFEFAVPTESADDADRPGVRLLDPETGELLTVVPYDDMTWTQLGADGEELSDQDLSGSFDSGEPLVWIIAAAGEGVLVEQLEPGGWPIGAASNGEIVLVGFADGTFARIELP